MVKIDLKMVLICLSSTAVTSTAFAEFKPMCKDKKKNEEVVVAPVPLPPTPPTPGLGPIQPENAATPKDIDRISRFLSQNDTSSKKLSRELRATFGKSTSRSMLNQFKRDAKASGINLTSKDKKDFARLMLLRHVYPNTTCTDAAQYTTCTGGGTTVTVPTVGAATSGPTTSGPTTFGGSVTYDQYLTGNSNVGGTTINGGSGGSGNPIGSGTGTPTSGPTIAITSNDPNAGLK